MQGCENEARSGQESLPPCRMGCSGALLTPPQELMIHICSKQSMRDVATRTCACSTQSESMPISKLPHVQTSPPTPEVFCSRISAVRGNGASGDTSADMGHAARVGDYQHLHLCGNLLHRRLLVGCQLQGVHWRLPMTKCCLPGLAASACCSGFSMVSAKCRVLCRWTNTACRVCPFGCRNPSLHACRRWGLR